MLSFGQLESPFKAIDACEELELVSPNDVVALSGLGKANQDMGQYQVALEFYEAALGLAPDYRPAQQGKNEVDQLLDERNQGSLMGLLRSPSRHTRRLRYFNPSIIKGLVRSH